jgi:hypothetical protein
MAPMASRSVAEFNAVTVSVVPTREPTVLGAAGVITVADVVSVLEEAVAAAADTLYLFKGKLQDPEPTSITTATCVVPSRITLPTVMVPVCGGTVTVRI